MFVDSAPSTITNATFYENATGRRGGALLVDTSAFTLANGVFAGNSAGTQNADVHQQNGAVATEILSCPIADGDVATAIVEGADGQVFLNPAADCVHACDEAAAADLVTGFVATGSLDWTALTTREDGVLDDDGAGTTDITCGAHY